MIKQNRKKKRKKKKRVSGKREIPLAHAKTRRRTRSTEKIVFGTIFVGGPLVWQQEENNKKYQQLAKKPPQRLAYT